MKRHPRSFRKLHRDSSFDSACKLNYLDSKRTYQNLLVAKKKNFSAAEEKLDCARSPGNFFKALSYFKPKYQCTDSVEYVNLNTFHDYFSQQFNLYPDCIRMNEISSEDCDLDANFTFEELASAIQKLSNHKSAGSDCIPNEVWKSLSGEPKCTLLESFNLCWNTCVFPECWSEIIIAPIFKKGDKTNPDSYRPISLLNTSMKLYTTLLCNRLNIWCEKYTKISDYQAAYVKNYGCEDHIFVLNSAIQANVSKKRKLYALFVDLSKDFDTIRHEKLCKKVFNAGLSRKFIRNIQVLYSNVKARIRTKFGDTDSFPIKNSVFQGETLSPKLFSLFIEDIVKILKNMKKFHL
jgi:hypothetical protein